MDANFSKSPFHQREDGFVRVKSYQVLTGLLIGFIGYSFSGLLYFSFSPAGFNIKRLLLTLFFVAVLIVPLVSGAFRQKLYFRIIETPLHLRGLFGGVIVLGFISSLLSSFPERGLQEVGLYLLLTLAVLAISISDIDEKKLVYGLVFIGVAIGLYSLGYGFKYLIYLDYGIHSWPYSIYQFSNPRALNHAQGWLIPLFALLPLCTLPSTEILRKIRWLPLVAMYFFMLVSGTRGLPLALMMAFAVAVWLFGGLIRPLALIHAKAFMVALPVYLVFILLIPFLVNNSLPLDHSFYRESYDNGRFSLWLMAWEAIKSNGVFGLGPQHFVILTTDGPASPHNSLLQWACEWGVPATLGLTWIVICCGYSYQKNMKQRIRSEKLTSKQQWVQVAVFCSVMTAALHSMISGVITTPLSQMLMILVIGVAIRFHYKENVAMVLSLPGGISLFRIAVGVITGALVAIYFVIFHGDFFLDTYSLYYPSTMMAPRFWLNGAFHM
ncbi:O-antigen ligase family protein [Endozoicomonas sp. Mp262]|uniref:O-antigen ligase family protein n=1 Tax=Endozoicomonas sp. Mp262 TaxID=2919499 RepID=UPI0021D9ACFA